MNTHDWIIPDWPAPSWVKAVTTTRAGGVSVGAYASMNLAAHVADDPAAVVENRRRLREALNLPAEPAWLTQVHGRGIVAAEGALSDAEGAGGGAGGVEGDAALSRTPGQVCVVMTADCLPVLLCDRAGTCVAAAHAGWRGLADGVIEVAVAALDLPGNSLLAWLGPAIGPLAFEVGDEVRAAFVAHNPAAAEAFTLKGARWHADLYRLAHQRLAALGITEIYGGGLCTYADAERFYSYRRDGATGRMATLIWITADR
ncbi:MAG: peptidoglycan editing factor PgeF [Gammaproteobacteria bacterium]|nr:peptidoglycan editing factor PgeF [Gammaproteobacteria bacterium]